MGKVSDLSKVLPNYQTNTYEIKALSAITPTDYPLVSFKPTCPRTLFHRGHRFKPSHRVCEWHLQLYEGIDTPIIFYAPRVAFLKIPVLMAVAFLRLKRRYICQSPLSSANS